jgi:glyoxylase-like metal-dependent hydrolase (beta-lactamase superfamily II)
MELLENEILSGIYWQPVRTLTLPPHQNTNSFIIYDGDSSLVIDAVSPRDNEDIGTLFSRTGIKSIHIAIVTHSHRDHYIGLKKLLKLYGGKVGCHPTALPSMESALKTDKYQLIQDGDILTAGDYEIRALFTPGHSPDHLCFYIEKEGILFSGDVILGWGTSIIVPPQGNMIAYMNTLEELTHLDIKIICPGHGPIIRKNANELIKWYLEHRKERESKILDSLSSAVKTPREIAEIVYTEEDYRMYGSGLMARAERIVIAHIEKLEKEGLVSPVTGEKIEKYRLT